MMLRQRCLCMMVILMARNWLKFFLTGHNSSSSSSSSSRNDIHSSHGDQQHRSCRLNSCCQAWTVQLFGEGGSPTSQRAGPPGQAQAPAAGGVQAHLPRAQALTGAAAALQAAVPTDPGPAATQDSVPLAAGQPRRGDRPAAAGARRHLG